MKTERKRLFLILFKGIFLSLTILMVSCATTSNQSLLPEAINSIKETDSVLFGYINPSVLYYGRDESGYFTHSKELKKGGLGLLLGSKASLVLSFKNTDTQKIYSAKVSAFGSRMREFLIILPKATYSLSISTPLLKNIVTAKSTKLAESNVSLISERFEFKIIGERNAIYLGELELISCSQDLKQKVLAGHAAAIKCDLSRFEEKKDEFLRKYPQFMGKILIADFSLLF